MIFVVDAGFRRHFAADLAAMYRHRKSVFVDRAGWKTPVVADQEVDRFDLLEDTRYLLVKDQPHGPVLASARLLTTTGPHLIRDLYPASYRAVIPFGPKIWEISRFCASPRIRSRGKRLGLLGETICGVIETAMEHGIDRVIFAANRALLPIALHCGWEARTLGPTMSDGSDEVTAVVAAVTAAGLRRVRDRYGIPTPVVRFPTGAISEELLVDNRNSATELTQHVPKPGP